MLNKACAKHLQLFYIFLVGSTEVKEKPFNMTSFQATWLLPLEKKIWKIIDLYSLFSFPNNGVKY